MGQPDRYSIRRVPALEAFHDPRKKKSERTVDQGNASNECDLHSPRGIKMLRRTILRIDGGLETHSTSTNSRIDRAVHRTRVSSRRHREGVGDANVPWNKRQAVATSMCRLVPPTVVNHLIGEATVANDRRSDKTAAQHPRVMKHTSRRRSNGIRQTSTT